MEEDPALQKRATDRAKEVRARTMIRASNSAFSIFSTGTTQHAPSPSTISRRSVLHKFQYLPLRRESELSLVE
jgi:hypothetical protein